MTETYHKRGLKVDGYKVRYHPNYNTWSGIKTRCDKKNDPGYKNYGGRGITYCERWKHFANFCEDMGIKPEGLSIERIDNDGNYEPSNCKWATYHEQGQNKRTYKTNTLGSEGVIAKGKRFIVSKNWNNKKYQVGGSFATEQEAQTAHKKLTDFLIAGDFKSADEMCNRPARYDSKVGIRGISVTNKGAYIVRRTDGNGKRHYVGHFLDLKKAKAALEKCKKMITDGRTYAISYDRKTKARNNSKTEIKGISPKKGKKGFTVRWPKDGKRCFIGQYEDLETAREALEEWKQKNL